MALPVDFWRTDQLLNIFKTKPCQRLSKQGVCQWKSQCQYSHVIDWPRRQPRRHRYSAKVCPRLIAGAAASPDGLANPRTHCSAGLTCPFAHSKEEVLYHPDVFKTRLCEEHGKPRSAKKSRCHRFYCPFAHGTQELRTSSMSPEDREECLRTIDIFASSECCNICTQHLVAPDFQKADEASKALQLQQQQQQPLQPPVQQQPNVEPSPDIAKSATSMSAFAAWPSPPMPPMPLPLQPRPRAPMPCQPTLLQNKESLDVLSTCPAKENIAAQLICGPCSGLPSSPEPYDPFAAMRNNSPVFVTMGADGRMEVGPREAEKAVQNNLSVYSTREQQMTNSDELKGIMYAML